MAIGAYGVLIGGTVLAAFALALLHFDTAQERAVTIAFLSFAFARLWHVPTARQRQKFPPTCAAA